MCNLFQEWSGPINKACFACDYFWNLFIINTRFQVQLHSHSCHMSDINKVYIVIFQNTFLYLQCNQIQPRISGIIQHVTHVCPCLV